MAKPSSGKIRVSLLLTPTSHEEIKRMAHDRGMSVGTLFEELMRREKERQLELKVAERAVANSRR